MSHDQQHFQFQMWQLIGMN